MHLITKLCFFIGLPLISARAFSEPLESHFACKEVAPGRFRPYYLQAMDGGTRYKDYSQTPKGLLGQNPMRTLDECERAVQAANNEFGVICSRTGIDGWKPTIYTGTSPGRADYGYLGGSSISVYADCLKATESSSRLGVCFWGGSSWYISPIDREGIAGGPYATIDQCIERTNTTL
jgi:hypothetical protein